MGDRLDGKTALVTGAASGIAAACAARFVAEGATVLGFDLAAQPADSPASAWSRRRAHRGRRVHGRSLVPRRGVSRTR